jgi:2-dehydro-3-deoxyphosphogluconate aldolase/(4S)-4-hydroxy-2-oxoglutarate aldolase
MNREQVRARIEEIGIIPAVRVSSAAEALFASKAVFGGGIPVVEITMTVPDAVDVIGELTRMDQQLIVGAGTVLDMDTARRSLDAGASFLTSTGLDLEIVEFAGKHDIPLIPGALTPTEVMTAKRAGADFIKIFPCSGMGGPTYIRSLKGPFPHIRLVASGGVNQQNVVDFLRAGATAIGVGQHLLPREAIRLNNIQWIHELARRFLGMVKEARAHSNGN